VFTIHPLAPTEKAKAAEPNTENTDRGAENRNLIWGVKTATVADDLQQDQGTRRELSSVNKAGRGPGVAPLPLSSWIRSAF
jgi:hypothetical protein